MLFWSEYLQFAKRGCEHWFLEGGLVLLGAFGAAKGRVWVDGEAREAVHYVAAGKEDGE